MKNFTKIIVPAFALAIGFTSCDKVPTEPTTQTPTTTTPSSPTPVQPNINGDYSGVMVALKMGFNYSMPQLPIPVNIESEMGIASFYSSPGSGTMVDAGTVKINTIDLKKETNNSYLINATTGLTPSTLNLGSGVAWSVSGAGSVSAVSYTHTGIFPDFDGTLPTEVDRAKGLDISLGSNISGADSVYVVIIDKEGKIVQKAYGGNPAPAMASFTASDLSGLSAVTDNAAYVEVVPFTYKTPTISGKQYVFIKEYAAVTAVNIK